MTEPVEFHLEPVALPETLAPEWTRLHEAAGASFFTSWHWIGTLLEALPAAARPLLLRGTSGGATVALALLGAGVTARQRGLVRVRGLYLNETGDARYDTLTIEHNGLIVAAEREAAALDGLLAWFASRCGDSDELFVRGSLRPLPADTVARHRLWRAETAIPSYSLDLTRLAAGDGDLGVVLSANSRQQLHRAFRHFERAGALQLTRAATAFEAQGFFTELKTLHSRSWTARGKVHAFATPFFERFHRLLIDRAFAAGAIELVRVGCGDAALAYLYNFRRGDHVYAYQSGLAAAEAGARPGAVSYAMAIGDAYRRGAGIYDFLAGHNRLKHSFSTERTPMLWQSAQRRRLSFRLERLGLSLASRVAGVTARSSSRRR